MATLDPPDDPSRYPAGVAAASMLDRSSYTDSTSLSLSRALPPVRPFIQVRPLVGVALAVGSTVPYRRLRTELLPGFIFTLALLLST